MKFNKRLSSGALVLGLGAVVAVSSQVLLASDHQEAPRTTAQIVADIGDYYAWHEGETLNLILTFSTFADAGMEATYDSDVLYTLHFDTDGDNESDLDINARFAQDTAGAWGMQISGIGETEIVGAVDTMITEGDVSAYAGSFDDPFFFDQEGFLATLETGTLAFDPTRDSVAGFNVTSIALQAPLSSVVGDVTEFQTWATTSSL